MITIGLLILIVVLVVGLGIGEILLTIIVFDTIMGTGHDYSGDIQPGVIDYIKDVERKVDEILRAMHCGKEVRQLIEKLKDARNQLEKAIINNSN